MIGAKTMLEDLRCADYIASRAADLVDDGGSCNRDCVSIGFGKTRLTTKFKETISAVCDAAHCGGYWAGKRFEINSPIGQGGQSTAYVEAMAHVLTLAGWDARVHFVTD